MGYIDADTHVIESHAAWSHLSKDEEHWRPTTMDTDGRQAEWHGVTAFWYMDGQLVPRGLKGLKVEGVPPDEARSLENPAIRLEWMDRLDTEVQVIIPSFFLVALFEQPEPQIALTRSYNRWMADNCKGSGGRLRWSLVPPLLDMDAAVEEVRFGAKNGAASVLMRPIELKRLLTDSYFNPLYEAAQECGLAIGVHIGNIYSPVYGQLQGAMFTVAAMAGAFVTIFASDMADRFPHLRFGFLEGGSEWLPFAMHEIERGVAGGARKTVDLGATPLAGTNLFIDCTFDENLPHILEFAGPDNLVLGSDFGHTDFGTDVGAHGLLLQRTDVDPEMLQRICEANGRRLYGLPTVGATIEKAA